MHESGCNSDDCSELWEHQQVLLKQPFGGLSKRSKMSLVMLSTEGRPSAKGAREGKVMMPLYWPLLLMTVNT